MVGEDGIEKSFGYKSKKAEKIYSLYHKKGTMLSICSKNNENDMKQVLKNFK